MRPNDSPARYPEMWVRRSTSGRTPGSVRSVCPSTTSPLAMSTGSFSHTRKSSGVRVVCGSCGRAGLSEPGRGRPESPPSPDDAPVPVAEPSPPDDGEVSRVAPRSSLSPRALSTALDVEVRTSPAALEAWVAPSRTEDAPPWTSATPWPRSLAEFRALLRLPEPPSCDSAVPTDVMPPMTCWAPSMIDRMPSIKSMIAL
nr:hypothetical protein [Saccharomonospora piscinae]